MAQKQDESLKDKLLQLGLEEHDVTYIIKKGEQFLNDPDILAERLKIEPKQAKKALEGLKAHKEKQLSLEIEKFGQLVKENPDTSLKKIALLHDIDDDVVSAYSNSLKSEKITDAQKGIIKEKYNAAYSITEIAEELNASPERIMEYVEKNCITFKGKEGERILEIIFRNFEKQSIMKLNEMIINKNVKLQEKICWDLKETNPEEYKEIKRYFEKFEESQYLFDKNEPTLSIEDKTSVRSSSIEDIEQLSIRLNRVERVIRDFLLQYFPDEILVQHHAEQQSAQILRLYTKFGLDSPISHTTYRKIILDSSKNLIENAKKIVPSSKRIFEELLPLAFYLLKCSLPLGEFTQIINKLTNMSLTTLDIFHLIFQMSDPVVRGLCIEHYSFSNPVPFHYPRLDTHILNLKQKLSLQKLRKTNQFEICKELWYFLQQFNGLVSFGLGWASWNPIGKSQLLDLMFESDFVNGSPQTSPFHLNSIDIQMTKNLFGKREKTTHESTQWAYIDCHGCSDTNVIRNICQNLDITLVHVSYSDYKKNRNHFEEELHTYATMTKHVYALVRYCPEDILKLEPVR